VRDSRIPGDAFVSGHEFPLQLDRLLLLRTQRELVLEGPQRADGGQVAAPDAAADRNSQGFE
jgi:hypothetical protein